MDLDMDPDRGYPIPWTFWSPFLLLRIYPFIYHTDSSSSNTLNAKIISSCSLHYHSGSKISPFKSLKPPRVVPANSPSLPNLTPVSKVSPKTSKSPSPAAQSKPPANTQSPLHPTPSNPNKSNSQTREP